MLFTSLFPAVVLFPAGKDLSKVSMPVTLNEPLSALQRLCEELQYSELLDEAAGLSDVHDRMVRTWVTWLYITIPSLLFYQMTIVAVYLTPIC